MTAMREMPDKAFDLAIVDPPYGMNSLDGSMPREKYGINRRDNWDCVRPTVSYFIELQRVSVNQIIWGGNYFIDDLHDTKTIIVWDKIIAEGLSFAMIEIAWTSFSKPSSLFRCCSRQEGRTHPTQKPVKLYEWLLKNYAKQGDKILDTHGGSMGIAIACYNMGFDLDLYEIDKDYFDAGSKRLEEHKKQLRLFEPVL